MVVVADTKTRRCDMDIESELTDTHRKDANLVTDRLLEQIDETMEEFDKNYTDFYWYLWEQDSGNCSS